ncbi:hypothetical protein BCR33DRAFT_718907 [Rhizoclosmatium globosum]|uniref:Potassium channel domain-containing protein n=1 Tax=Rhizoclosmatium globosum TaxID=329046 RepID=A0A1Y2C300_9FUNG|nr:hypothetical protein BCR33DRAFT_718907 [Rhizoclosmatium globosum]|eukprot:ORY41264.1 hypothetical protein BCR33DRAFT_718907 [Rhizoclosmatium globosum]
MSILVNALLLQTKFAVADLVPPKFKFGFPAALCNHTGSLVFSLLSAILLTVASYLVENAISNSNGNLFLGLGGASLHLSNAVTWMVFGMHLINFVELLQLFRNPGSNATVSLSMGELERVREGHIFPIAVYSFDVVMNLSIVILCYFEKWSFRWAEQWYFATITTIGFSQYGLKTDLGKIYCQILGVYGFLHLATILGIFAGMVLDSLKTRVEFLVTTFDQDTDQIERKSVVPGSIKTSKFKSRFRRFARHHEVLTMIFVVFAIWAFGTISFAIIEDWRYVQASYFIVNVVLTEGYMDLYPSTSIGRIFIYYYSLLSYGVWAYAISFLVEKLHNAKVVVVRRQNNHRISVLAKRESMINRGSSGV